jgi:hypothetical protein
MTEKFLDLLEKSVITQSIITILVLATCVYLWLTGVPLPEDLKSITLVIVGFFFGSKTANGIANAISAMRASNDAALAINTVDKNRFN